MITPEKEHMDMMIPETQKWTWVHIVKKIRKTITHVEGHILYAQVKFQIKPTVFVSCVKKDRKMSREID
jgi:hypothetical protein